MGYDLHLTRASDWLDSEQDPLSLDDWITFARSSKLLFETTEISTGDGVPVFVFGSNPLTGPALYWGRGQVTVRGADESHVSVLVAEASKLGAKVLGDDGEVYE